MQFIDKKIAVLGLGAEALDVLDYLRDNSVNSQITIFDQQQEPLAFKQIKSKTHLIFSFGKKYLNKGLTGFDLIFRSPGFPYLHPALVKARQKKIVISSALKLFFHLCPAQIIGVTGTKGKGTTSSLIAAILKRSGRSVYLAGNIGKPVLNLLPKLRSSDIVCLELSSFQLHDFNQSPHFSVVLNTTSEHLNIHNSVKEYRQAKFNLVKYQTVKDICVANADYSVSRSFGKKTKAKTYWFSRHNSKAHCFVKNNYLVLNLNQRRIIIGPTDKLLLRGQHNWENITAAILTARLAKASVKSIRHAVYSFKGLEHRLELVRQLKKVSYYNDSFSTTPETAMAAIASFQQPLTLILGGSDKGSDFTQLAKAIVKAKNLKTLILIGFTAEKISQSIISAGGFQGKIIYKPQNLKMAVQKASQLTLPGGVVVLSPACASFDMFENYKDRGNKFKQAVWQLK